MNEKERIEKLEKNFKILLDYVINPNEKNKKKIAKLLRELEGAYNFAEETTNSTSSATHFWDFQRRIKELSEQTTTIP